ncbi:MAG TPA: GTPase Era [archaeon]|nr:GTPase Era [archaeon]
MEEVKRSECRRSGVIAIAGRPNVGKSTLLNRLLGQKLSIVSHKTQTTRQQVLGILTKGDRQLVFIDTPGIIEPRDKLQEYMIQSSFKAVSGADLVILIVEADEQDTPFNRQILERLKKIDVPRLLVMNKIDLVEKSSLLPLIDTYRQTGLFEALVPVSALLGDGLEPLMKEIESRLPEGPFLYSEDQIACQPMRFFAAELIREALYELLHEEVPYAATVQVDEYKERPEGKIYIRAVIYTERESQKKIVIGRKGEQLKKIGRLARAKIEEFVESGVYLDLWVKVKEKWRKNQAFLDMVGYNRMP